jgi:CO/xanthine dehydrogenase Mo-binding subunit
VQSIDGAAALSMPGVVDVVTAADLPKERNVLRWAQTGCEPWCCPELATMGQVRYTPVHVIIWCLLSTF